MEATLSEQDMSWLKQLATDEPVKPEVPAATAQHFVNMGLAIKLVEGGMQLTDLGRGKLEEQ